MKHKEFDAIFKDMDKIFEEFDKVLKTVDQTMKEAEERGVEGYNLRAGWQPYKPLVPIKIGKKWYWNSAVFRRYVLEAGKPGHWQYGTSFDVLRDSK